MEMNFNHILCLLRAAVLWLSHDDEDDDDGISSSYQPEGTEETYDEVRWP